MSAPTGRSQSTPQNSQHRYVEQGFEDYGSQLTSSPGPDVDDTIARMGNMRISDDRQMLHPSRSNSTPVTSSGLRTPFTQQRSTSPRPRPNNQEHMPLASQYPRHQDSQYPPHQEQMSPISQYSHQEQISPVSHYSQQEQMPLNSQYPHQDRMPPNSLQEQMPPDSQYTRQDRMPSTPQYSHQEQAPPNSQYPHQDQMPPTSQYPHQEPMPPNSQYSHQDQLPPNSQYSHQDRMPPNSQYSHQDQMPPTSKYSSHQEQLPPSQYQQPQERSTSPSPHPQYTYQEKTPHPSQRPQYHDHAPPSQNQEHVSPTQPHPQYPQHQEQTPYPQQEYQDYGYRDDYYNYPQGQNYYAPGQNFDPAVGYPEDAFDYPPQQYAYDQGGYDYQRDGYGYDHYQQEYPTGEGYYGGEMQPQNYYYDQQYYYDQNYDPNYGPNYPPQDYPQDEYGAPMYYDQQPMGQPIQPGQSSRMDSINVRAKSEPAKEKPSYTPEAIEKYRTKAKDSGNPATLFSFAKYLIEAAAETEGNEPDPKNAKKRKDALLQEAIKLIKRLAQGIGFGRPAYPEAQFYLANCYSNGSLGLPLDPDKAFGLYMQASKQNHGAATYRTAVCYEVGAGTKRDPHRATQFFKKAAALGDTAAMYKLGMIMLKGLLAQQLNTREAVIWLKRAAANADEENPHALHQLGLLHAKPEKEPPEIPSLIRNEKHAIEEFKRAADLGYAPSCYKLGCCYEYGQLGCPVDPRQSIKYYSKAAEKGDPDAELALSGWYLTGSEGILKQSDDEAYLWARKAADKGFAKAEYAIGYYSEVGIGANQNLEEAR
ncbi:767_t:CDS:2, partial [Acaulospora colombiana]